MTPRDEEIRKAIRELQSLIAKRVRAEQLRDQLTGLPNLAALNTAIGAHLEKSDAFWVAFVEVDRFKSINDQFSYENADALLKHVADALTGGVKYFETSTTAYRAHGDEYYLLGSGGGDGAKAVEKALGTIRADISAIRIRVQGRGIMQCTVSIGWIVSSDLRSITDRGILLGVERAISEAKYKRDCVVRYKRSFERTHDVITLRGDCAKCRAKFSFDVKRNANRAGPRMTCPNCKAAVVRPPPPAISQPASTRTRTV